MRKTLALLALVPLLGACGEPGASQEMQEGDGQANAPGTEAPDQPTERGDMAPDESGTVYTPGINPEGSPNPNAPIGTDPQPQPDEPEGDGEMDIEAILEGDWRTDEERARDQYRHPAETLAFFGLEPDMTVVEVWPGGGWYTKVIAPYLAEGGGTYYAAGFDPEADSQYMKDGLQRFRETFVEDEDTYGDVNMSVLAADKIDVAPAGSADMVLTFRNVHNWVMNGFAEDAFAGFYEALKPGGVLGVVDHRLPEDADDAMERSSGYVKVSTVRDLAESAGFEYLGSSEANANPQDDADHPFGVWTLPPTSRTSGSDGAAPADFDPEEYAAIGESDRFTLKFQKPLAADGALME
ncbi:class I SAM-dependent methyltransferase [Parvularcula dongshanensis]|uniref:Putative methyltransferase n=1 Tax=Parvularcula dongshanensis TaxID=1173995 RepID=A0A840HXM9_9PROT|nr:class I SAM-dependent methyltransferase [Parvularcula dongshanensis]MBB4657586.1 putative methyltransferase [Parvularcula dongshanensis]